MSGAWIVSKGGFGGSLNFDIKLVPSDHARLMKAHWERRKLVPAASMEVDGA